VRAIILCLLLTGFPALSAPEELQSAVATAKEAIVSGNSDRQVETLSNLRVRITRFIDPNSEGTARSKMTPQRAEAYHELYSVLEPIRTALLQFVITSNGYPRAIATDIVEFVRPNEEVRTTLLKLTETTDSQDDIVARAYDMLFKIGLDTPSDRQALAERFEAGRYNGNLLFAVSNWKVPEAKPFFRKQLGSPDVEMVKAAAEYFQNLGAIVADVLPALKATRERIRVESGDYRVMDSLNNAISRIVTEAARKDLDHDDRSSATTTAPEAVPQTEPVATTTPPGSVFAWNNGLLLMTVAGLGSLTLYGVLRGARWRKARHGGQGSGNSP
jgi:hypothetical protein